MSQRELLLSIVTGLTLAVATVQAADPVRIAPGRLITRDAAPQAPAGQPAAPGPALPGSSLPGLVMPGMGSGAQPMLGPLSPAQVAVAPSLCVAIPMNVDAIIDKLGAANQALQGAGSGSLSLSTGKLKSYFVAGIRNGCCSPNVTFSVQDQQAAGCLGSDTVAACMDKLTRQCIRKTAQTLHIREDMQQGGDSIGNLSARTGELAQQLRSLLMILP